MCRGRLQISQAPCRKKAEKCRGISSQSFDNPLTEFFYSSEESFLEGIRRLVISNQTSVSLTIFERFFNVVKRSSDQGLVKVGSKALQVNICSVNFSISLFARLTRDHPISYDNCSYSIFLHTEQYLLRTLPRLTVRCR